jgi:K+/H+ antiporter YhaU regulatory subunit KhtT
MSFDHCNAVKWRQNQMLNGLTITAVNVNEDGEMFGKKVSERNVDSQEHVSNE